MLRAMSRLLIPILLAVLFADVSSGASAQAASFKHCGSAGAVYAGQVELANVRAKGISCREARRFARRFTLKSGPETSFACAESLHCTWRGWSCLNDARSGDLKHRCRKATPSGQRVMVVKWSPLEVVNAECGVVHAAGAYAHDVRARGVSCRNGRRVARSWLGGFKHRRNCRLSGCRVRGYHCRSREIDFPAPTICHSGKRRVTFIYDVFP